MRLMKAVAERVGQVFYNTFDRGYPEEAVPRTARALDQVAIVAPKKRGTRASINAR
jgi:hypothetical protein